MKISKLTIQTCFVIILFCTITAGNIALAEIAIVTNKSASAEMINAKTAKKLFLGKINSIPGMDNFTIIGQLDSSPIKTEFTKKITRKNLSKYKAYWSKRIFSGKSIPPKEFSNDTEVKSYISSHNDTIGYINASAIDDSVKVLFKAP